MKKLVETIVQQVVDEPEVVEVKEHRRPDCIEYVIRVGPNDVGKLIGRRGRVADAIRAVVAAAGQKRGTAIRVKFDTG